MELYLGLTIALVILNYLLKEINICPQEANAKY